jgi:hypothetical protein
MTAAVRIQPQGFSVQYPKTQWRVSFVEDSGGKFRFQLCGRIGDKLSLYGICQGIL